MDFAGLRLGCIDCLHSRKNRKGKRICSAVNMYTKTPHPLKEIKAKALIKKIISGLPLNNIVKVSGKTFDDDALPSSGV